MPLRLHWSFLLFLAIIAGGMYLLDHDARAIVYILGLVVMMFLFVLLHELAHVATARFYGVTTRSITLHPLGGVSMLERVPDRPGQEALVGFSGPLVNLLIAALLLPPILIVHGAGSLLHALDTFLEADTWLMDLFLINVLLGVFNLLPAFPLDGGRVMRATLAIWLPYARATRIAAFTGRTIAIASVVFGLFWNLFFVIIGIFVFFGAAMEERSAQLMKLFAGKSVEQAMRTDAPTVHPEATFEEIVALRETGGNLPVVVVEDGLLRGVIDRETLAYLQPKPDRDAHSVMRTSLPRLTPDDDLAAALRQFAGGSHDAIPVVEPTPVNHWGQQKQPARYIGLVTTKEMEKIYQQLRQEAIARRALRRRRKRGGPPQAVEARVQHNEPPDDVERWVPEGTRPRT